MQNSHGNFVTDVVPCVADRIPCNGVISYAGGLPTHVSSNKARCDVCCFLSFIVDQHPRQQTCVDCIGIEICKACREIDVFIGS